MRLEPIDDALPRLARARDTLDAERRARCGWYESFGRAIAVTASSPDPELRSSPDSTLRNIGAEGPTPKGSVVLEHVTGGDRLQPGLAIAWAQRHLDVLAELEFLLSSAYERISL
jgi:hypothetical protein